MSRSLHVEPLYSRCPSYVCRSPGLSKQTQDKPGNAADRPAATVLSPSTAAAAAVTSIFGDLTVVHDACLVGCGPRTSAPCPVHHALRLAAAGARIGACPSRVRVTQRAVRHSSVQPPDLPSRPPATFATCDEAAANI